MGWLGVSSVVAKSGSRAGSAEESPLYCPVQNNSFLIKTGKASTATEAKLLIKGAFNLDLCILIIRDTGTILNNFLRIGKYSNI